jgi:uncharacterized DUF497 family protein
MDIEFDPAKDRENLKQHGVSLAEAVRFEWGTALVWPDTRFDYGELRYRALGYVGSSLYCMAFTERGEKDRIISLRRATPMEIKYYADT